MSGLESIGRGFPIFLIPSPVLARKVAISWRLNYSGVIKLLTHRRTSLHMAETWREFVVSKQNEEVFQTIGRISRLPVLSLEVQVIYWSQNYDSFKHDLGSFLYHILFCLVWLFTRIDRACNMHKTGNKFCTKISNTIVNLFFLFSKVNTWFWMMEQGCVNDWLGRYCEAAVYYGEDLLLSWKADLQKCTNQ